jgi:hypothetical protein
VYDQSFNKRTLERVLKKWDFRRVAAVDQEEFKNAQLIVAEKSAAHKFNAPQNPLESFLLKKKTVFKLPILGDELVARKLCQNLKQNMGPNRKGRASIVSNLELLLEEGVPYRVYRLDVKSYYESFSRSEVISKIEGLSSLNPQSKGLLRELLRQHEGMGGTGVPRGLSLSAVLSDLMMEEFDKKTFSDDNVYFYARYVDDIVVMTSSKEQERAFTRHIESTLPTGLTLNTAKKTIVTAQERVNPTKKLLQSHVMSFDYLGYGFSVYEPKADKKRNNGAFTRTVTVDIAASKVKKLKTRVVRSFLAFERNNDWPLLRDRIKFLTQNFSVYNSKAGSKKLAGIYYSYPQVSDDAQSLKTLDKFLRHSILSKSGRISSKTSLILTGSNKRELLSQSFIRGHESKNFVYFSAQRISEIQKCWKN